MQSRQTVVHYTVYFSGNSHQISDNQMLASFLYKYTAHDGKEFFRKGYDGCGVTNGLMGTIFGSGLKEQAEEVVAEVLALVKKGHRVILNCYAHSRGAMAALTMIRLLRTYDRSMIEINLAMLDPVPGNLLTTAKIDFMHVSLANQNVDVSDCRNLTRVIALYPNIPLPDIAVHAPLLPRYPDKCDVEESIVPGCHAETQYLQEYSDELSMTNRTFIVYARTLRFLQDCGTRLNIPAVSINQLDMVNQSETQALINCYQSEMRGVYENARRDCHATDDMQIVTDKSGEPKFLNMHHKKLSGVEGGDNDCVFRFSNVMRRYGRVNDDYTSAVVFNTFKTFSGQLFSFINKQKMEEARKVIFVRFMQELESKNKFNDAEEFTNALRNVIAVALIKEPFAFGLFNSSNTANEALRLLRQRDFKLLSNVIMGSCSGMLRLADLCMFVTGNDDEGLFEASRASAIYQLFKPGDNAVLMRNNIQEFVGGAELEPVLELK